MNRAAEVAASNGFMCMDRCAELVDVSAVGADEFMELVARDAEFFGPVRGVGGYFRVDQFGVVRTLGRAVFVERVGFVSFGSVVVLRHDYILFPILMVG
jgi:hypothetical protein